MKIFNSLLQHIMKKNNIFFKYGRYFPIILFIVFTSMNITTLFSTKNGAVKFVSEAPLEIIKASSKKLNGILDTKSKSFIFKVAMSSLDGFNSPLQKIHFNENYIESDKYPHAKFKGKIIEDINFSKSGSYNVRAKGKFSIHGVEKSRIIKCKLNINGKRITVSSKFTVLLADHDIEIPTIVNQKLAEKINVQIKFTLNPK